MATEENQPLDHELDYECPECGRPCRGSRALRSHLHHSHRMGWDEASEAVAKAPTRASPHAFTLQARQISEELVQARSSLACIQSVGGDANALIPPIEADIERLEAALRSLGAEWKEANGEAGPPTD